MALAAVGFISPTTSANAATSGGLGTPQRLTDIGGAVVTEWTISDLRPSSAAIPDYPLNGRLWEATATVRALRGTPTPMIPMLNPPPGHEGPLGRPPKPFGTPSLPTAPTEPRRPRANHRPARSTSTSAAHAPPASSTTTASKTCSPGERKRAPCRGPRSGG